jgi:Transcriptional antiterminator
MDRRFIQLFKILATQKDYIKSDILCSKLNIRPRTLREDIRQYKNVIEKQAGCRIESKPNAGYILHVFDEKLYNEFLKTLLYQETNTQFLIPVNQEERIFYIVRYFLSHEDYVRIDDLAEEIYVSKSTLNADIREVKERLSYFNLKLVSRPYYGLKISGTEKDIRSCMAQYFYHFDNYDEQYIENIRIQSRAIDKEAFEQIKDILYTTISKYAFKLTDFGFQNLSIHLLISLNRIKQQTYIEEFFKGSESLMDRIEMTIAKDLAKQMDNFFDIHIPESEIHYIAIHLMGKQALQQSDHQFVLEQATTEIADAILAEIKTVFALDLTMDLDLYAMMTLHLQPMLNRVKFDLHIANPLNEQIKKDSPIAFEMAVVAGKVIARRLHKTVSDNELGYLALHFSLALERMNHQTKKNIIIVCASGAGSSQILLYKIRNKFHDYLDKVLVTEAYKLVDIQQEDYDLILSTIPLTFETKIPVIQVQYFLDENDVSTLENVLIKHNGDTQSFISHCFREEFFFNHIEGKTRDEVIANMCERISEKYPLLEDFYALVMERESVSPTEVGNRIAIPHPIRLVMDETFVAVGVLDKPIKWDKQQVKFVFMLCIQKDTEEALSIFNEVLSSLVLNSQRILELEKQPEFKTIKTYIDSLSQEKSETFKESIFL